MQVNNIQSNNTNYIIPITSKDTTKNLKQDYSVQTKKSNKPSFNGYLSRNTEPIIKRLVTEHIDSIRVWANYKGRLIDAEEAQNIKAAKDLGDRVINKLSSFASALHKDTCLNLSVEKCKVFLHNSFPANLVLENKVYNQSIEILNTQLLRNYHAPRFIDDGEYILVKNRIGQFYELKNIDDLKNLEGVANELMKAPEMINEYMFLDCFNRLKDKAGAGNTIIGNMRNVYNRNKANKLAKAFKIPDENGISWAEKLKEYQESYQKIMCGITKL